MSSADAGVSLSERIPGDREAVHRSGSHARRLSFAGSGVNLRV